MSARPAPPAQPDERLVHDADARAPLARAAAGDLAGLAALVCETRFAVLSYGTTEIQWVGPGVPVDQAPDVRSLMGAAREDSGVLEIGSSDAEEQRPGRRRSAASNPAMFAGTAIRSVDGRPLGVLAVYDDRPRVLSATQRAALIALAGEAATRFSLCEELVYARALIENAPVAIYHADEDGDVSVANPAYRRLLNLGPGDSLRAWANGVHPEDRVQVESAWVEFCRSREPTSFEYRGTPREGVTPVLAEQVVPARGIPGFVGSITDVSERVATHERLARLETLHHNTFEQAPIGITFANREGRLLRCNPAFASMLGFQPAELEGQSVAALSHRPDAPHAAAETERLWQGETGSFSIDTRYRRKDRSILWLRTTTALVRDREGASLFSVGFCQDISRQKAMQAALDDSRNVLEAIIADVPVAILTCDLSGQMLVHNRAAAELLRLPVASGDTVIAPGSYALGVDVYLPDGVTPLAREERPLSRALRGETITNMELKLRAADGTDRSIISSARQIFGHQGEILGAVVVSQDITEQKRAEFELERVHRQLLDASRVAGMAEVATNVLHNVGNVLTSVNVSAMRVADRMRHSRATGLTRVAGLLAEQAGNLPAFIATDERGRQLPTYLARLAEQLQGDERIALEELATLQGHIDHIKETVAMQQSYARRCGLTETVDVPALVEDCLRMNTGALTRHGVTVQREIGTVAPITVDKHRVLQILVNLVRNAKYACDEAGRADRLVTIRVEETDAGVRVSVIDNGVGIAGEDMPRLFSHGFTTRQSGHGFGLHSAAIAAKELGGSLTASSAGRGCGATFVLDLPREAPHA